MEAYSTVDREEGLKILDNQLVKNPDLLGTYVAFEPNAFDGRDPEYNKVKAENPVK